MVHEVPSSDLWFIFLYSKRWIHEELAAFYVNLCPVYIFFLSSIYINICTGVSLSDLLHSI